MHSMGKILLTHCCSKAITNCFHFTLHLLSELKDTPLSITARAGVINALKHKKVPTCILRLTFSKEGNEFRHEAHVMVHVRVSISSMGLPP